MPILFFFEIQKPLAANILKVDRERRLGKIKGSDCIVGKGNIKTLSSP